jgi:antitoxin component YwqK of YwqJK toxin-antitoxin module
MFMHRSGTLGPEGSLGVVLWFCLIWLSIAYFTGTSHASCGGKVIEEDSNGDGKTDRIAHLDPSGNLCQLDIDGNRDGKMDTFQHYQQGNLIRLEKDRNGNGRVDEKNFFQNGKRSRFEKIDARGRTSQVIEFDSQDRPVRSEKDTTGNGRRDTVYRYESGILVQANQDANGDGKTDQTIQYDSQGRPVSSTHDLDGDGRMECSRTYQGGEPVRQECDCYNRGRPDAVTEFRNGKPILEKRDANGDGVFELVVKLQGGAPSSAEEDLNRDGRADRFTEYDSAGRPRVLKESTRCNGRIDRISYFRGGRLSRLEEIGKGKAGRKTITEFENDKPVSQTIDEDGDGKSDLVATFDDQGKMARSSADTNKDGHEDTWTFFEDGQPIRAEQDLDHDGRVDAKTEYRQGTRVRLLMDSDHDGRFETTQIFDQPPYTVVTEVDENGDGHPETRCAYQGDILRRKETFDAGSGTPMGMAEYDETGRITLSRESDGTPGVLNMTWRYDQNQTAILAEKDTDGDGQPDAWFHYQDGRVVNVEEDRNRDGMPDVWETYGQSGKVTYRQEDLDFDGKPDIEKRM